MSNSNKFDQDPAIVCPSPPPAHSPSDSSPLTYLLAPQVPDDPSVNAEGGVLGGADEGLQSDDINAPADGNYDGVQGNEISQGEFEDDEYDGVKESNIIDGERSTRAKNFAQGDEEADRAVDAVLDAK
ncbi:hypothetical protein JCM21900_001048 [Sporobolomyces salmonicolor]